MRNIILLLAFTFLCASCTKWLEVQPSSQISEDRQFSTEDGFKDALIGVYQKMSQPTLYGQELSFGFVDVLAQNYTNPASSTSHTYMYVARYMYTDAGVQGTVGNIWGELYGSIAQVNYILKHVDNQKGLFTGINYNVIKGEALALRAYLHFDLLRLFGNFNKPDALSIPYMKDFTVVPQASISARQVMAECLSDLKAAEDLLIKDKDLIHQPASGDNFLAFRKNRLNYWAIRGLTSRISLYAGNKDGAFLAAKDIIDNGGFTFLKPSDINGNTSEMDRTASMEHVFAIYVSNLKLLTDAVFKTPTATGGANTTLLVSDMRKRELFTATADIRLNPAFWSDSRGIIYYSKLWQDDNSAENIRRRIPLIKLSELYLIAAETAPSLAEKITYFNKLRDARIDVLLSSNTNEVALKSAIDMEYRKDFICEGQLFYYYKRQNTASISGSVTGPMSDEKYVLPKPVQEIEFGK